MDKLDQLISKLKEAKEELEKSVNSSYKSQPNMAKEELICAENGQWSLKKDAANPKLAPKDRKVKELQSKIDAGTYKPDASKIADAIIKHPEKPLKKSEDEDLEKARSNSSVYNAGTHPMKGRPDKPKVSGSEYEPDHAADYDTNFKAAHAHYKDMGISLSDDRIHNILKVKLKKK